MLYEFLKTNRAELISRCHGKAAKRALPHAAPATSEFGIPQFLSQLTETFRVEQTPEALARHKMAGQGRPSLALVPSDIAGTAAKNGDDMRKQGLTIDQVVHSYGDLCQALTELALETGAPISVNEFHTFNRCLDDAIADAVTAYSNPSPRAEGEPARFPAREMRNLLETMLLSFAAIQGGDVGVRGSTAALHEKSLLGLRDLIDHALAEARPHGNLKEGLSP
jgi:hypothetical protein